MRTAYQRELDSFVKAVSDSDFSIREVTKSAFSQARAKLNPWAFKRLNEVAVNSFYDGAPYKMEFFGGRKRTLRKRTRRGGRIMNKTDRIILNGGGMVEVATL